MGKLGSNSVSFTIDKNVAPYLEESILQALEMIGLKAESYAKAEITNNGSVDTGLLRNSIAHAVAGEQPSIGANYRGTSKKARTYKADKPDENGVVQQGTYTGHTPKRKGEYKVYIGSNVYYAPYVELGHHQTPGRFVPQIGKRLKASWVQPKPFIKPAVMEHIEEYEQILKNTLQTRFGKFVSNIKNRF